jgi:tRNA pseudouridine55 synthase
VNRAVGRQRKARGRQVDGILLLDKPAGITSNQALQRAKAICGVAKAGHTGSLDPLATGVLPLCFGEATKFSHYLLNADKRYQVTLKLGARTTTGDVDGEVIETFAPLQLTQERVLSALSHFRGEIEQIPSMYSALKHQGKPLYELARAGIEVERPPRRVTIHALELLRLGEDEIELDVRCSKGTYIRTLAEDLGKALGSGAHVVQLRRIEAGPYEISQTVTLDALAELREQGGYPALDALLLPASSSVSDFPQVKLNETTLYYFRQGQPIMAPQLPSSGWVRIVDGAGSFIGVGEILDDGRLAPRRLVASH